MIPKGWIKEELENIAFLTGGYAFKSKDYSDNGKFILRTLNIQNNGEITKEKAVYISEKICGRYKQFELQEGDTLFVMVGATLGKVGYITKNILPALLNQNMWLIRPKSINPKFLNFLFKIESHRLLNKVSGSAREYALRGDFRNLPLILPPIKEQEKIVSILSNIDFLIQQVQKEIECTQILKTGLLQKLLTKGIGHKKFKKVKWFFDKEIEIPEEWDILKGSDACVEIVVGVVVKPASLYSQKGMPFLRSFNIKEDQINEKDIVLISNEANELNSKSKLKSGDVLIVRTGYPGTSCVVPKKFIGGNCVDLVIARPKNFLNSFFLSRFINSDLGKSQVLKSSSGIAQQHFNVGEMKNMLIPIPSVSEQQKITSILSNIDLQIKNQKQYESNLELLKKGLMLKLLTGNIRVKI